MVGSDSVRLGHYAAVAVPYRRASVARLWDVVPADTESNERPVTAPSPQSQSWVMLDASRTLRIVM